MFILAIKELVHVFKSYMQLVVNYEILLWKTSKKTNFLLIETKIKQITGIFFSKNTWQSTENENDRYVIVLNKNCLFMSY